jgi:serine racemase
VSLAAKLRGVPAYIVIPKNAPKCKVENVKRYGGQIIWSEVTMQSREAMARKVQEDTGAVLIHPFNDGRIIRFFHFSFRSLKV